MNIHEFKRQDVLNRCRYYKGEESAPAPKHAFCWGFERQWAKTLLGQEYPVVKKWIQRYIESGFAKFRPLDGTPLGVKAVMFEQYDLWSGGHTEGFPLWYLQHYLHNTKDQPGEAERIKQGYYQKPTSDHEVWQLYDWAHLQDAIAQCRYYREDCECPDDLNPLWWETEKDWAHMVSHHKRGLLDKCLEDYIFHDLGDYRTSDNVPSTLKAYTWYRTYYPKETWSNPYDESHPIFQSGGKGKPYPFRYDELALNLAFKITYEQDYLRLKESPALANFRKPSKDIPTFARKYHSFFIHGYGEDGYCFLAYDNFLREAMDFGFEIDGGKAFKSLYPKAMKSEKALAKAIHSITDAQALGNAILSQWRAHAHGTYSLADLWSERTFFTHAFYRLFELTAKSNNRLYKLTQAYLSIKAEDIPSFARKYIPFFKYGEDTDGYQLTEYMTFPSECESFGFDMDGLHSYREAYKAATADAPMSDKEFIGTLTDIHFIGTAIFSMWRYYNHWAIGEWIWSSRNWFLLMFQRLLKLSPEASEKRSNDSRRGEFS